MFLNHIGCYPLSKMITLFIGSILLTNIVTAHKCYVCGPDNSDINVDGELIPTCLKFNYNDQKFIKNCDSNSKGCSIQTNGTFITRACEDLPIEDCKKANHVEYCYCTSDLCNKYHPTYVDDDNESDPEDGEGSGGIKNIIDLIDYLTPATSIEPSHVTKSIPKHSNSYCYRNQADITLIIAIFLIGKQIFFAY